MRSYATEWILLIALLAISAWFMACFLFPNDYGWARKARPIAAHADINGGIKTALGAFEVDIGHYPQNLQDLVVQPGYARPGSWHGPYLDKVPLDPWGTPYVYYFPGKHNPNGYDLLSIGPDLKEGTADDIGNW